MFLLDLVSFDQIAASVIALAALQELRSLLSRRASGGTAG